MNPRDAFLEAQTAPPGIKTVLVPLEEGPGTAIGRYRILEKVGEGGFGVVYVAEQREPVKRRVASRSSNWAWNGATSLSFSPDGKHLASMALVDWSAPVGLRLWDLESRRTVSPDRHFPPSGEYSRACFSPDGRHLAAGGGSGRITILDWAAGRVQLEIQAHTQAITSLAYSPDGKLLASGSGMAADDIRLWNPATGEPTGSLAGGHHGWIPVLQFSADGQRLFSGSADQTIGIWDVPTRRLKRKLRGHLDEVYSLVFDAGRTNLITGCKDGTLARWDIDRVRQHGLRLDLPGNNWSPVFAGSGSSVAMLHGQGAVAL